MKNNDYWKSFANTGKIDDYLHYIACTREEFADEFIPRVNNSKRSMDISKHRMERDKEGGLSAGINNGNGNGSIGHAGW